MTGVRLLQAMAGARVGGAEAFFERLAGAFARAGLAQRVLIRREPERARRLVEAGVDVVELGFGGPLDLATRLAFAREIRAFAPELVLTWMSRASAAMPPRALLRGRRPVVVGRLGGYYDLKYFRRCDWLVANTSDLRDWVLRAGWPAARVEVLPNFVDAAPAPPIDRATLDTPAGATVALALGRLHANKAFDVLINAASRVPDLHVWIAGEGSLDRPLRLQATANGIRSRVHFLGWRRDVAALLAAADILVCPSRREPLGNVILEGWAQAKPVIAAASAGPGELIGDGETGLLVPVDDAHALADAIDRLRRDPALAASLAAAGHGAYQAGFTEGAVVRRWIDFFARIGRAR